MFAVASSSINIDGFCAKILANAINCFWPAEYEFPRSGAISSNPLFNEFTTAFNDADELIKIDIYAAREKDTGLVSSDELGDAIRKTGLKCTNVHSHDEATSYIKEHAKSGDVVLTVGAGDVVLVGEKYLAE